MGVMVKHTDCSLLLDDDPLLSRVPFPIGETLCLPVSRLPPRVPTSPNFRDYVTSIGTVT